MPYKEVEATRRWREKNREHLREWRRKYHDTNREYHNAQVANMHRRHMHEARRVLFEGLGGKCQRCGITDERVLRCHHTNGDGGKHRGKRGDKGYTATYYRELLQMHTNDPCSIELLCMNCHYICHHPEEREIPHVEKLEPAARYAAQCKLTDEQVRALRADYDAGLRGKALANKYSLAGGSQANYCGQRLTYRWVEG